MQTGCLILVADSLVTATALTVVASMIYGQIVDDISTYKPLEPRIRSGDRTKILNVLGQHADTFPASRKRVLLVALGLLGIVSFVTFAVAAIMCFGSWR
jgi:hypothetical protein